MSRTFKDTKQFAEQKANQLRTIPACIGGIPSSWKKLQRRIRRSKEKSALRNNNKIPTFKKTNEYDFY